MKRGEIISKIPMKGKVIDWFSMEGKDITIKSDKYGIKTFNVIKVYRDNKLTKLALSYEDKYIGNLDSRYIKNGWIDVLFEKIAKGKFTTYYDFDETIV